MKADLNANSVRIRQHAVSRLGETSANELPYCDTGVKVCIASLVRYRLLRPGSNNDEAFDGSRRLGREHCVQTGLSSMLKKNVV